MALVVLGWVGAIVFTLFLVLAIASWVQSGDDAPFGLGFNHSCKDNAFGCNAVVEALGTLGTIGVAFGYFMTVRKRRVVGQHLGPCAKDEAWRILPTATEIAEVVGRTGLCEIIEEDLAETKKKIDWRPQVIVGGVGDGKTAVLVRLTELLHERGAVPVAVRLGDASTELDFVELARRQFMHRVGNHLFSQEEGDKVWRVLRDQRLVVILADGLEEALPDVGTPDKIIAVTLALEEAREAGLPLVIASRPDEIVDAMDASIIRLEPLASESAVRYIREARVDDRDALIDDLARVAEVIERPLYLKLARDLHARKRLEGLTLTEGRVRARFELLHRWFEDEPTSNNKRVSMRPDGRQPALTTAEKLTCAEIACAAMAESKLDIEFDDLVKSPYTQIGMDDALDARVRAQAAERLEVVAVTGNSVRFRHGIMQAYLGALHLPQLLEEGEPEASGAAVAEAGDDAPKRSDETETETYLTRALRTPSRELMMALVLCCAPGDTPERAAALQKTLCAKANRQPDLESPNLKPPETFGLLAAAYEIGAVTRYSDAGELEDTVTKVWSGDVSGARDVETTEAKLRAVAPIAEAGEGPGSGSNPETRRRAYKALWHICTVEDSYAVRFQAAQALAAGGSPAFEIVKDDLTHCPRVAAEALAYHDRDSPTPDWEDVRRQTLLAWIAPLMAATCEEPEAKEAIKDWVKLSGGEQDDGPGLHLGVEAALAQGFKWEANRIECDNPKARHFLTEQATALLRSTRWWVTKIGVLQALALWALKANARRQAELRGLIRPHEKDVHSLVRGVASLCVEAVQAARSTTDLGELMPSRYLWIDEVGVTGKIGPKELRPYGSSELWIPPAAGWYSLVPRGQQLVGDMLVLLNLIEGSEATPGATPNEKTNGVRERETQRCRVHGKKGVPACLARAECRDNLLGSEPDSTDPGGGSDHKCPEGCGLRLCPYPAERPFRGELDAAFCSGQRRLLRASQRSLPTWLYDDASFLYQGPARRKLSKPLGRFWTLMEQRSRLGGKSSP